MMEYNSKQCGIWNLGHVYSVYIPAHLYQNK